MNRKISSNLLFSFLEKAIILCSQFAAGILLVRLVGEQKIGILSVMAGAFSIISLFNISWDSILFMRIKKNPDSIQEYGNRFLFFGLVKSLVLLMLALLVGSIFNYVYHDKEYLWGILSLAIVAIYDSLVSFYFLVASLEYKQKIATFMVAVRWISNLLLMLGLFWFPTLWYAMVKEIILLVLLMSLWCYVAPKHLGLKISLKKMGHEDWAQFFHDFRVFNLWNHFTAVMAQIIYKIDSLILSWFASPGSVASYAVALNGANAAGIVPGVLSYQMTVAHAKAKNEEMYEVTGIFFRMSFLLGLSIWLTYCLAGRFYLKLLTGRSDVEATYQYMLVIVSALLLIKTLVSSLVTFINVHGSVKSLFLRVTLPTALCGLGLYVSGAYIYGAWGSSYANLLIAVIWLSLMLKEMKRTGFPLKELINIRRDISFIKSRVVAYEKN